MDHVQYGIIYLEFSVALSVDGFPQCIYDLTDGDMLIWRLSCSSTWLGLFKLVDYDRYDKE